MYRFNGRVSDRHIEAALLRLLSGEAEADEAIVAAARDVLEDGASLTECECGADEEVEAYDLGDGELTWLCSDCHEEKAATACPIVPDDIDWPALVGQASFKESGLLTCDRGIEIELSNRQRFQLTVVRSR